MSAQTSAHDRAVRDQFTRQAEIFAAAPELHGEALLTLLTDLAAPRAGDRALDVACGPGSVVCAFAPHVALAVGVDATPAMLAEATKLAESRFLANTRFDEASAYALPFPDGAFEIVSCRFAFHHLDAPERAFAEMRRVTAPGGRILLCDGVASDDPAKAAAFNAMERRRDPSTAEFRTLAYLRRLYVEAGLEPSLRAFEVPYRASELLAQSFPVAEDRASLQALFEASIAGDTLGMGARRDGDDVRIAYRAVALTAVSP